MKNFKTFWLLLGLALSFKAMAQPDLNADQVRAMFQTIQTKFSINEISILRTIPVMTGEEAASLLEVFLKNSQSEVMPKELVHFLDWANKYVPKVKYIKLSIPFNEIKVSKALSFYFEEELSLRDITQIHLDGEEINLKDSKGIILKTVLVQDFNNGLIEGRNRIHSDTFFEGIESIFYSSTGKYNMYSQEIVGENLEVLVPIDFVDNLHPAFAEKAMAEISHLIDLLRSPQVKILDHYRQKYIIDQLAGSLAKIASRIAAGVEDYLKTSELSYDQQTVLRKIFHQGDFLTILFNGNIPTDINLFKLILPESQFKALDHIAQKYFPDTKADFFRDILSTVSGIHYSERNFVERWDVKVEDISDSHGLLKRQLGGK